MTYLISRIPLLEMFHGQDLNNEPAGKYWEKGEIMVADREPEGTLEWHKDCSHLELAQRREQPFANNNGAATMSSGNYMNIPAGKKREYEPTFFFIMNCLVYSRMETGFPSNHNFYDEDVNLYIANLLSSFMNPEFHKRAKKYLSKYDIDLFEKVRNSTDVRLKYTIYKTNADFLLISIGIFKNSLDGKKNSLNLFQNSEEARMGRGKAYYQFAYSYSQTMFKKSTAVCEVLEKLSKGFERYVEVLSHMRGEYFNILDRLSSGEIYHLERSVDKFQADEDLKKLQDEFLDIYSQYLKCKKPELKNKLNEMVEKIQKLDETFRFRIED